MAYAMNRGYALGIDDKQAIQVARRFEPAIPILGTHAILKLLLEKQLVTSETMQNWIEKLKSLKFAVQGKDAE